MPRRPSRAARLAAERAALLAVAPIAGVFAGRWACSQGYGGAVAFVLVTTAGPLAIGAAVRFRFRRGLHAVLAAMVAATAFNVAGLVGVLWWNADWAARHNGDFARTLARDWPVFAIMLAWCLLTSALALLTAMLGRSPNPAART